MATDPWADFNPTPAPTQQQPVRQSSPPPFIPGTPKPPPQPTPPNSVSIASEDRQRANDTWTTLTPEQAQKAGLGAGVWQQNGMGEVKQVSKSGPASSTGDSAEKVRQLRVALENLDSIEREVNGAMFGQAVGNVAGTEGFRGIPFLGQRSANVAGGLDMVQGDLINQVRLQMAEQGVVVGASQANTEKEAARLAASIANLAQTQDEANFLRGLQNARQFYLERLKALGVEDAALPAQDDQGQEGLTGSITYEGPNAPDGGSATPGAGGPPPQSALQLFGAGVGDLVQGVGDTAGIIVNPVGQMLYNATGYGDQTYDLGKILRDASGLPDSQNEFATTVNRFGAGAMAGGGVARGIAGIANPGTAQAVAQTIGRTPIRDTVAGAAAGAGSYAGRESGIPGGEIAGALAGGMLGYGGANALMGAFSPRELNAVAAAAGRQGVDLLPADVGGRTTHMVTSGTKASPLSAGPVVAQAGRNVEGLRDATSRVAQSQGDVVTTDIAGQNVRDAAKAYSGMTSATGAKLYEQANEAARGVKIKPLQTIAAIDEQLARLQQNPAATPGQIAELQRFRTNIENGVSVTGLRDARTALSQGVYDGQLRSGADQAMWKSLLGNLSSDITMGLEQAGRAKAARMFERADGFWKSRVETIDQVLQPIVGKDGMKSGEQVIQSIETMARGGSGGSARLSRLLGAMSKEDAGQVRAVLIDRLGKATAGAQDAAGQAFSPATFLTNWNDMTPQAKASLFSDTKLRNNLNDLAKIAEGMKASRGMENFSNTSVAIGSNLGVGAALAYANPTVALLGAGAQYMTGKLMASPGFARLLAKTAKLPPEQANRRFTEQLGVLAKSEPLIANDLKAVQQFLSEAASQSPSRAAADNQGDASGNAGDNFPTKPIVPGNLPLGIRYKAQNPDGSISTVRTMSIGTDQGEVLIPTVINGRVVSDEEAIRHFETTGENFGTFRTPDEATAYAQALHQMHERALSLGN